MDAANTPGTNPGMTPQAPEAPEAPEGSMPQTPQSPQTPLEPAVPQNTPAGMASSPSNYGVSNVELAAGLAGLGAAVSPVDVADHPTVHGGRGRALFGTRASGTPNTGVLAGSPLLSPQNPNSPLLSPSSLPSSPFDDSVDLGTPRSSDGEDDETYELSPPSRKEERDLIELRF